jgi:hypothetical protein
MGHDAQRGGYGNMRLLGNEAAITPVNLPKEWAPSCQGPRALKTFEV